MKILIICILISITSVYSQDNLTLDKIKNSKLKEDFTITDNQTDKYLLVEPSMMILNNNSFLYVLDYGEKNIKIFDDNGKFIKTFGKKGKGPGEFIAPFSMSFNSKSELIVYDFILKRFSYFSANGNLISTKQFTGDLYRFAIGKNDEFYIETRDIKPNGHKIYTKVKLYLFSKDLSKKTIIDSADLIRDTFLPKPRPMKLPIAFCSNYLWEINNMGELISMNSSKNIIKEFKNGELIRDITYNGFTRIKVSERDRAQFLNDLAVSFNGVTENDIPNVIKNNIIYKEYKPFVKDIYLYNNIYVLKSYNFDKNKASYYFFNENGVYLDKLVLNTKLYNSNTIVTKRYVYSLITDSSGNKIIKRYHFDLFKR